MTTLAINKLCKWRTVLAGWHAGTKTLMTPAGEPSPGVQAMRDLMDKWLIMRVEVSALAGLLIERKLFTSDEFVKAMEREADALDKAMERVFPGFRTIAGGVMIYDADMARQTMREKGFPP